MDAFSALCLEHILLPLTTAVRSNHESTHCVSGAGALRARQRKSSWSISYSRGRCESLSVTGRHATDTVRDREVPDSRNPRPSLTRGPAGLVDELLAFIYGDATADSYCDSRLAIEGQEPSWPTIRNLTLVP